MESLEAALDLIDTLVLDDCKSVLIMLNKYESPDLPKINEEIGKAKENSNEIYFKGEKYEFINIKRVGELFEFIVKNYGKYNNKRQEFIEKLQKGSDSRKY